MRVPGDEPVTRSTAAQGDVDPASGEDEHEHRTAVSARWSIIGVLGKQVLRLGFTLTLARILGPEEFGIASQAMVFLLLSEVMVDFGFGAALIQRKDLSESQIAGAFWFHVVVGIVLSALSFVFASSLAGILSTDAATSADLENVLKALPAVIIFRSLSAVPTAMLSRRMQFRKLAIAEIASVLLGGIVGVAAAIGGMGFWAVVIQLIVTSVCYCAVIFVLYGPVPIATTFHDATSLLWFGSNMFGSNLLSYAVLNADNFLISRVFGPSALAQYSLSFRTIRMPLDFLGRSASRFTLASYSRAQDDRHEVVRQLLIVMQLMSLVAFPLLAAVIVWSPIAVPLVFGTEWEGAVRPMQFLAVAGAVQVVFGSTTNTLAAIGYPHWSFRLTLYFAGSTITAFAVGVQYSVTVLAALYALVAALNGLVTVAVLSRVLPIGYRDVASALAPALTSMVGIVAGWFLVDRAIGEIPDWFALLVGGSIGLAVYVGLLRCCWWKQVEPQMHRVSRIAGLE